jgi:hypothetical protein
MNTETENVLKAYSHILGFDLLNFQEVLDNSCYAGYCCSLNEAKDCLKDLRFIRDLTGNKEPYVIYKLTKDETVNYMVDVNSDELIGFYKKYNDKVEIVNY